jgi:hypothetical protein
MIPRAIRCMSLATSVVAAMSVTTLRAQRPAVGASTLSGTVVSDDASHTPLGGAIVMISGGGLPLPRSVVTDADGLFTVSNLPTGRFAITATKPPYVPMAYGARRFGRPGTLVSVGAAEHVDHLVVTLPRGAVITGSVRDERAGLAPGVSVAAFRVSATGVLSSTFGPSISPRGDAVTTDDRGVYRIFGLPAGDYVVGATFHRIFVESIAIPSVEEVDRRFAEVQRGRGPGSSSGMTTPSAAPHGQTYAFAPTWFSRGGLGADPETLTVASGEERLVDLTIGPVPSGTVEGVIESEGGASLPSVDVALFAHTFALPAAFAGMPTLSVRPTGANGHFVFTGVTPGQYVLTARSQAPFVPKNGFVLPGAKQNVSMVPVSATIDVTMTGTDISGLSLTLRAGRHFSGRIVYDGPSPSPAVGAALRVSLLPADPHVRTPSAAAQAGTTPSAVVQSDGTFDVADVFPGGYLVSVIGGGAWSARSAMVGGVDALDVPVEFTTNSDVTDVVVTLSNRPSELSGRLQTASGQPATDFSVVVLTTDRTLWRPGARRVQITRPATDGRFDVIGLPSGDYVIAALTDVEPDDLGDPAFLSQLASAGLKVTLAEGEKRVQDLQIVK